MPRKKQAPEPVWSNKIIEHGTAAPDQLMAHPMNARIHPQPQQSAVEGSLNELGYIRSVTVNKRTGTVLDGHLRVALALRHGQAEVPVEYVDIDEEQEALALATLDPSAAMAVWDNEKLDQLLRECETTDAGLMQMLSDLAEDQGVLGDLNGSGGDGDVVEDDPPDPTDEVRDKWGTELGQLWKLGEHRVMCGDCTDEVVVQELLSGDAINLVWTDPPYGVSYGDKNKFLNSISPGNRIQTPIENDHASESDVQMLCESALKHACNLSADGGSIYVAVPARPLHRLFIDAFNASGFTYKHQLIWVKNQFVLGRSDYHYKHEPILYGWKETGAHYFCEDHGKSTVFEIDKPRKNDVHPTMKPVELVAEMVRNSSRPGDIVYDPFLGSGTTLIAAEQLNRKCRGCELSPGYVAVILERWANLTGKTPELITE